VIHLPEMTELMDDDIIDTALWSHNESVGEIDSFFAGATSPSRSSTGDFYTIVLKSMLISEFSRSRFEVFFGF
jgi:hypothetical protein